MIRDRLHLGLIAALVVLVAAAVALYVVGRGGDDERLAGEYDDVARAAEKVTLAFLSVDHTRMDELTDDVLEGATGTFRDEYESSIPSLTDAAEQQESFAEGSVDHVGISELDADSATAFVSAGSEVRNTSTDGETESRSWRIKLGLTKESGRWLVSQLEFVG